tara:strand:+ start:650 stop:1114 length:465 start_codon:yes stop_codon:yes gene_type:complete
MGWWDVGAMDGDTPLDIVGRYGQLVELECDYDADKDTLYGFAFTQEMINQQLPRLYECALSGEYDKEIWGQVLGVLIMHYGACMPREIREHILDSIEEDPWKLEGDEPRVAAMRDFGLVVESYPALGGDPVRIKVSGLFEVDTEKLLPPELLVQ